MKSYLIPILIALFPACFAQAASPGEIFIAFHRDPATQDAMAPAVAPATQGTLVKTSTDTWNSFNNNGVTTAGTYTIPSSALLASDGSASGATLSGTFGFSGVNGAAWSGQTKDGVMMAGWHGFKGTESITVANIPARFLSEGYTVYVYGDCDTTARTMAYTIGGTTKTIQDAGTFSGTFAEGVNYVAFTGLTASSFSITGNAAAASRSAVNGIRIVGNADLPPPLPTIASFTPSKAYVQPGQTMTFNWTVANATGVSINEGVGDVTSLTVGGSGQKTFTPEGVKTYTLTATNASGSVTASTRVGVGPVRPNILVFLADDMGWQDTSVPFLHDASGNVVITPLNQRYRTPGMESLAANGMKFTTAYACTVCSPSRVSLMTGQNATRHHVTTWTNLTSPVDTGDAVTSHNLIPPSAWAKAGLPTGAPALPRLFADAGYRTIHVGKAHFAPNSETASNPLNIGFDEQIAGSGLGGPGSYLGTQNFVKSNPAHQVPGLEAYWGQDIFLTEVLTREMNQRIARTVGTGAPFFAYMSHYAVHATFEDGDPRFLANYPTLSGYQKNFATLIEGMDRSLVDIMAKLDELGVAENTLIVFLGDNGTDAPITMPANGIGPSAPARGKKGHAYEGGIRVPMIVGWAKRNSSNPLQQALPIPAASRTGDMVAIWDVFPTVLGAAGVPLTHKVDGCDLRPYLRGEAGTHRPQEFVLNFPHSHEYEDFYAIYRKGDWKLIYRYKTQSYELYNLATDFGEQTNLAGNSAYANQLMTLSRDFARALVAQDAQPPRDRLAAGNPETPLLVPATYPAADTDGDGLPDITEDANRNGIRDAGETDSGNTDTDTDDAPDGAEIRLGLDPLDARSHFGLDLVPLVSEGNIQCQWPSKPGLLFRLETSSTLLSDSWSSATGGDIDAAAAGMTTATKVSLPPAGETKFFRVRLLP